jgi:hypothetical protein
MHFAVQPNVLHHVGAIGISAVPLWGSFKPPARRFPQTAWYVMRCYRCAFSHVQQGKILEVALILKAIHLQQNRQAAETNAAAVMLELKRTKLGTLAQWTRLSGCARLDA